jgi:ATP-dependent protease HslVU (ClpYQ) peptidase subunit
MTAEIAVLNRSAVALAADSAVTIGRGASAKIYNSVNKIFELHETAPVGIMVYGTIDFMGLPLETLIKQYRKQTAGKTLLKISDYKSDFITWLGTKVLISKDDEDRVVGLFHMTCLVT